MDTAFESIAQYTAALIFNYWHVRMQGERWSKLPQIVQITGDLESRQIEARVDFHNGHWAKILVFVVAKHRDEEAIRCYENEIAFWDRRLFYEEMFEGESFENFDLDQRLRLSVSQLYPEKLQFNSLELTWKLVHAELEFFSSAGQQITTQVYPIGELRVAYSRKQLFGIVPISGDDYSEALKLLEGFLPQQGESYE